MNKLPVVIIAGPTGVGKTNASIGIAKKINGEIISADSMQIYKGMDIGTAKITSDETQGVVHHLIDIVSPCEKFSVCDYVEKCKTAVEKIFSRGKIPIMVGGTGLYIDSFINGIDFTPSNTDEAYRNELSLLAQKNGNEYIHNMLKSVDEKSAQSIHPNNLKRVIRALEYFKMTGETISHHNDETKKKPSPYNYCYICFTRERQELYERIDKRVDIMLKDGLIDEVKTLLSMGCKREHTSMQALGYKEVIDYLENKCTYDEMVEILKRDSRRYAKKQLTWFRKRQDIFWLNLSETSENKVLNLCVDKINATIDIPKERIDL